MLVSVRGLSLDLRAAQELVVSILGDGAGVGVQPDDAAPTDTLGVREQIANRQPLGQIGVR